MLVLMKLFCCKEKDSFLSTALLADILDDLKCFIHKLNVQKLETANAATTKDELKRKTAHDQQVVKFKNDYERHRKLFAQRQSQLVRDTLLKKRPHLKDIFSLL
jgi:hypothetical protein